MSWGPLLFALFVVGMSIVVLISLRRNSKMIEAFNEPDLGELSACFDDRRIEWAKRELGKRGWQFVESTPSPNFRGKTILLFHKAEGGEPIKSILHFLNRKLQLPIGKWEFSRAPKGDAD